MFDTDKIAADASVLLEENEVPRVVFMGANFGSSIREGGSTRIVVVTDTSVVSIFTGLLKRTEPRRVDKRWHPSLIYDPDTIWPGRTLIGEMWGRVLPGLWVHRRYEPEVRKAREHADWLYGS